VLVGHSYGGAVITNAATGNPNVKALVYVDAFATFDGFPHPDLFRPRITSVTQPAFDIGATTKQLLLDRLSGRGTTQPKTIGLPAQITYRESCGCDGGAAN
jgi:pimeloyl-ACP methyl ester carboxylesterase